METPICIVDAKTLIAHIHTIKGWIYNGQLRLVVPACTLEQVDQICEKSKETKSTQPKEAARPRSSGKPAKKEFPTFDINPFLAKSFLSRLKSWKEEDGISEQKGFFQEKENHGAVSFQEPNEFYTPWKDIEVEEEKPQMSEERPSTWAEALRRKQYLANGTNGDAQAPKGPAKPKLVAKTVGSDSSPWKIKRDAPKISAKDVPGDLRPLMSCALWRLHESIDRNDANELFLLSSQDEARKVAEKLNITVRSPAELNVRVTAMAKESDVDAFGDLEREFHIAPKEARAAKISIKKESVGDPEVNAEDPASKQKVSMIEGNDISKMEELKELSKDARIRGVKDSGHLVDKVLDIEKPAMPSPELKSTQTDPSNNEDPPRDGSTREDVSRIDNATPVAPWANSNSKISVKERNAAEHSLHRTEINGDTSFPALSAPGQQKASLETRPAIKGNGLVPKPLNEAFEEPEDSDEEVVVFVPQPKRFSAQKKSNQQSSRPTTPNHSPQLQKPQLEQSSEQQVSTGQAQAKPKHGGRGRNPVVNGHGHSQPSATPTIIDPDAFGRSFAVNPNRSPRNLDKSRSNHRPRSSLEHTQNSQSSRNARQNGARSIPPTENQRQKSPRVSSNPETVIRGNAKTRGDATQRVSPQRRLNDSKPRVKSSVESRNDQPPPTILAQPKSLSAKMMESEEFVPRRTIAEAQFGPIGTPPKSAESGTPKAIKGRPILQNRPKASESGSNTSDDFVSRTSVPTTLLKPQLAEANEFVPRSAAPAKAPKPEVRELVPRSAMQVQDKPHVAEVDDFVPRNAVPIEISRAKVNEFIPGSAVPVQDGPQKADVNDFVPRSAMASMEKPQKPSFDENVSRNAVSAMHNKPRTPEPYHIEPRASMGDVQYVLKSGSTRAATRGKGRLWMP